MDSQGAEYDDDGLTAASMEEDEEHAEHDLLRIMGHRDP